MIKSIQGPKGGLYDTSTNKTGSFQIAKPNGELNDFGIDLRSLFKLKTEMVNPKAFGGDP